MWRLGQSLQDLINIVGELRQRGIGFKSLHDALDTTTPFSRWGANAATPSAWIRTYMRESVRSQPRMSIGTPAARTPSRVAVSASGWSIRLNLSDSSARASPEPSLPRRARSGNGSVVAGARGASGRTPDPRSAHVLTHVIQRQRVIEVERR
ncbi:recombinase family protein [Kribbella sp. VKM Ac-2568]|uniref:recombinase family protein n=1 Tax=Kribbella sp. VKM Ac-2568 TaxID=2512219 RepID=UPI00351A64CD